MSVSIIYHERQRWAVTDWEGYSERARQVYWHGSDACRHAGPRNGECLLLPRHDGFHEGNGYDEYGPVSLRWS